VQAVIEIKGKPSGTTTATARDGHDPTADWPRRRGELLRGLSTQRPLQNLIGDDTQWLTATLFTAVRCRGTVFRGSHTLDEVAVDAAFGPCRSAPACIALLARRAFDG